MQLAHGNQTQDGSWVQHLVHLGGWLTTVAIQKIGWLWLCNSVWHLFHALGLTPNSCNMLQLKTLPLTYSGQSSKSVGLLYRTHAVAGHLNILSEDISIRANSYLQLLKQTLIHQFPRNQQRFGMSQEKVVNISSSTSLFLMSLLWAASFFHLSKDSFCAMASTKSSVVIGIRRHFRNLGWPAWCSKKLVLTRPSLETMASICLTNLNLLRYVSHY